MKIYKYLAIGFALVNYVRQYILAKIKICEGIPAVRCPLAFAGDSSSSNMEIEGSVCSFIPVVFIVIKLWILYSLFSSFLSSGGREEILPDCPQRCRGEVKQTANSSRVSRWSMRSNAIWKSTVGKLRPKRQG